MLLLRYQRQRQADSEDFRGGGDQREALHRTRVSDRDLKGDSHRAATRGTLVCIFVCGTLLLSLGVVVLCVGMFLPGPAQNPTPWLVIGPTCIVLGVLVLLLSVEIILKLRKISSSNGSRSSAEPDPPPPKKIHPKEARVGHMADSVPIPVVIHPPTPLQILDATLLPAEVVQHR